MSDGAPNVAQLKADLDSGRGGDKVGGFDPAAAPLGTDDEAAGTSPSPATIAQARLAENRGGDPRPNASSPERAPDGRGKGLSIWPGLALGAGAGLLVGLLLALG